MIKGLYLIMLSAKLLDAISNMPVSELRRYRENREELSMLIKNIINDNGKVKEVMSTFEFDKRDVQTVMRSVLPSLPKEQREYLELERVWIESEMSSLLNELKAKAT